MIRSLVFLLALGFTLPLFAQTRMDAGVFLGQQGYENVSDDPRLLPGVELMLRRDPWNVQLALEYADLTQQSGLFTTHANVLYRWKLGERFALLAGAGATYLFSETESGRFTGNASGELAYDAGRIEMFARVRSFDFDYSGFRVHSSPSGPAFYLGARFQIAE